MNKIKEKIPGTPNNQMQLFEKELKSKDNKELKGLLNDSIDRVNVERTSGRGSRYRPSEKTIYLSKDAAPSTIAHELFHEVDYFYEVNDKGQLDDVINNDYNRLMNMANNDHVQLEKMIKEDVPEAFYVNKRGDTVVKEKYRGVSDILHGMTDSEILLGYGHTTPGYWKREKALQRETWAQFGRFLYQNDKEVNDMIERLFPYTNIQVQAIIKELTKNV